MQPNNKSLSYQKIGKTLNICKETCHNIDRHAKENSTVNPNVALPRLSINDDSAVTSLPDLIKKENLAPNSLSDSFSLF